MEKVVSELFPVYQFNDEHQTLHAIAMNIKAHRVAATRLAMAFMAFSDFAARLKSNSSNFILPQPVLSKRLAVLGDVLRYDFHSPVTQVCDACAQSEAPEHVECIHRGEYATSLEVRSDSLALRFL